MTGEQRARRFWCICSRRRKGKMVVAEEEARRKKSRSTSMVDAKTEQSTGCSHVDRDHSPITRPTRCYRVPRPEHSDSVTWSSLPLLLRLSFLPRPLHIHPTPAPGGRLDHLRCLPLPLRLSTHPVSPRRKDYRRAHRWRPPHLARWRCVSTLEMCGGG